MYTLELSKSDIKAIEFSGYRYGWSDELLNIGIDEGVNEIHESDIWTWKDAVDSDDSLFTLIDPDSELWNKLFTLYNSIV